MRRRSKIVRRLAVACALLCAFAANSAAADGTIIQLITDGGGSVPNRFGQVRQLAANGTRRTSNEEISEANRNLSLIYLAYFPETLDQNGAVEMYARTFFGQEWVNVQRSPEYRNPIQRSTLLAQWRARIDALPKIQQPTIKLLVPIMLQKSQYQPDTAAVPVRFALEDEMTVSSGETQLRCIQVDKEFSLTTIPIANNDVDAFFTSNQNNRVIGRTAAVFVELILDITGKAEVEGVGRPRCQLAAQVQSITAYEYRGL